MASRKSGVDPGRRAILQGMAGVGMFAVGRRAAAQVAAHENVPADLSDPLK